MNIVCHQELKKKKSPRYNQDPNPWLPVDGVVVTAHGFPALSATSCVSLEAPFLRKITRKSGKLIAHLILKQSLLQYYHDTASLFLRLDLKEKVTLQKNGVGQG